VSSLKCKDTAEYVVVYDHVGMVIRGGLAVYVEKLKGTEKLNNAGFAA